MGKMHKNVLEFLENSANQFPNKTAVIDENKEYTYIELIENSKKIGSQLSKIIKCGKALPVLMEKGADTLSAFFGIAYAGCCYSLMNPQLPSSRLAKIKEVLGAELVITDDDHYETAAELFGEANILKIDELMSGEIDEEALLSIRRNAADIAPLYINFTSGSTGVPKGVVINHRSVIDFIRVFTETFGISEEDIIANQAPFDFDVSVKDIYSAISTGATLVIVPKQLFSNPTGLIDFLCEHNITVMIWAVSALCLITTFHGLDYKTPDTARKILFSGEVMPEKHLKQWMEHLPEATFVNLYGPTEITCNCTYHIVDRNREYDGALPIGKPFDNENVFLLDDDNNQVTEAGVNGEICVAGTALSPGYYNAPEQTAKAFVQNPLNPYYPEIIYRTGDLGCYDENGDIKFCGRKDFQIKHMGHRIELEEIERAIHDVEGIIRCCCIFDERKSKLYGFYIGEYERRELYQILKENLPEFMIPGALRKVEELPLTKNGKIDRKALREKVIKK